jgi:hypothetical protein
MQRQLAFSKQFSKTSWEVGVQRPSGSIGSVPARSSGSRRCTMRVLKDGNDMVLVYEAEPAVNAGPRSLVFESSKGRFRLDTYPPEWRRMGDRELLALIES